MNEIDPQEMLGYLYEKRDELENLIHDVEHKIFIDSIDEWEILDNGNP